MNYVIANPEKSSQIFEEKDVDITDVKFNNPDKEYKILDDGEYSNTDTFSNCPETPTTNTTENNDNHETHDFCLNEFAMNYAKEYATSMVTDFEKEEVHVDWFRSDINIQSEDDAHKRDLKGTVSINKSWIHLHQYLFYGNNKYFVNKGGCKHHSKKVIGHNVQVLCSGLKECLDVIFSSEKAEKQNLLLVMTTNSDQLTKDILHKELLKTIVNFFERKAEVSKECKLDESQVSLQKRQVPSYM
ncbi:7289_t:CDS:2, partial [Funneliformis caledonium]